MEIFGNPITGYTTSYYSKIIETQSKILSLGENSASIFSKESCKNVYFIYYYLPDINKEIEKIKSFFKKQDIFFLPIYTHNKEMERIETPWGETYKQDKLKNFTLNLERCINSKNQF